jgi:hypothetical protein
MCRISLFAGITADLRDFAASIRWPSLILPRQSQPTSTTGTVTFKCCTVFPSHISQNPLCALFSTVAVTYFTEFSFVVNAPLTTGG